MEKRTFSQKLDPRVGPKKILSLDGGGLRGMITLAFLERLESMFRVKYNDPDFTLSDEYDLIGGTSTGSIIATAIALGTDIKTIIEKYKALGPIIFSDKFVWWFDFENRIKAKYDDKPLIRQLEDFFENTLAVGKQITLGSNKIKTGLCIVAKRADTNSTWLLLNHPKGQYYSYNHDMRLVDAIRASAAAPSYFLPHSIEVKKEPKQVGAFVDGGVSMSNNPALELLKVATMKGYEFEWKKGIDDIELTSIGTGMSVFKKFPEHIQDSHLLDWAKNLPDMFMQDANWQVQTVLQWIGKCDHPWFIDREIGTMSGEQLVESPVMTYKRYNVMLEKEDAFRFRTGAILEKRNLTTYGYGNLSEKEILDLHEMSNTRMIDKWYEIGMKAAIDQIV